MQVKDVPAYIENLLNDFILFIGEIEVETAIAIVGVVFLIGKWIEER